MNVGEHGQLHRDLGVYVLGGLDPTERDRLEHHLADCDACREELASLAVLPGLLARAAPDANAISDVPPLGPVIERLAEDRRRARVRNRIAVSAAAVAAALALVGMLSGPLRGAGSPVHSYVSDSTDITASVEERAWGMAVQINAAQLPPRKGYVAVAITASGHRTQVASWTATGQPVTVDGSCYLAPADVDRMEIVEAPGEGVLAVLRPES